MNWVEPFQCHHHLQHSLLPHFQSSHRLHSLQFLFEMLDRDQRQSMEKLQYHHVLALILLAQFCLCNYSGYTIHNWVIEIWLAHCFWLLIKKIFPPIIWIFTEGETDRIESRLPFKIFSTLCEVKVFDWDPNWQKIAT